MSLHKLSMYGIIASLILLALVVVWRAATSCEMEFDSTSQRVTRYFACFLFVSFIALYLVTGE